MVKSKITNNILSNQQINFKCASMLNQITKVSLECEKIEVSTLKFKKYNTSLENCCLDYMNVCNVT